MQVRVQTAEATQLLIQAEATHFLSWETEHCILLIYVQGAILDSTKALKIITFGLILSAVFPQDVFFLARPGRLSLPVILFLRGHLEGQGLTLCSLVHLSSSC